MRNSAVACLLILGLGCPRAGGEPPAATRPALMKNLFLLGPSAAAFMASAFFATAIPGRRRKSSARLKALADSLQNA
jgi:hypothetical protein